MSQKNEISRRQFVAAGTAAALLSTLPAKMSAFAPASLASSAGGGARGSAAAGDAPWKEQGIQNLAKSPYAKLRNVPVHAVTIPTGFWAWRREVNVTKSIPSMFKLLDANGRLNNFRRLTGKSTEPQRGPVYSDSDVYKWTEAVGFALQSGDHPEIRALAEGAIADVVAAQQPDGYLNTYYVGEKAALCMTPQTQTTGHELYNIGHMLQGAIAYYRATGDRKLLDAGIRFVNDFLLPNYGPAPKKPIVSGHPEIEMALIELYRITGDKRQLDLAGYILGGDARIPLPQYRTIYMFCGTPFTARTKLEGHAVRAMYACCGSTDYYLETGDQTYWKTLNTLWDDMTRTKMYVTGGVGSRSDGEAFGDAYELPNYLAYGESCAAIGNFMWNWRMLAATGDAKFTDVMERALYNGINSGMSLDGTLYCYRNPLAFDPTTGEKIRNPWYDTTCCPPNLERTFAALPGYFYSTSKDGLYLHFYENSELNWQLENGMGLKVVQKTNYPWDGNVEISVAPAQPASFTFFLRIPGWAEHASISVNGQAQSGVKPGAYLPIERRWSQGDVIQAKFDMAPQILEANPNVIDDLGRVAIQRGPLIYCMEGLDQPDGTVLTDLAVQLGAREAKFHDEFRSDLFGGAVLLRHDGVAFERDRGNGVLYPRYSGEPVKSKNIPLTFIPYYAWSNRQPSAMEVWTPFVAA
ncbi:MAG TPA: beta-L-arabinofuranosidase domain-containing protein [Candidatus Methylomirabilis sp.]|nr:beta-L-arabinofuranosidase domain-containing protein [Candidatus Methylomirabilis sp.]